MKKCIFMVLVLALFGCGDNFCIAAESTKWDYFLQPEGTKKAYEGQAKGCDSYETYSVVHDNDYGEIKITIRNKMFIGNLKIEVDTYYILDSDRNQVMEIGSWCEATQMKMSYENLPKIILDLPLVVGKKWGYVEGDSTVVKEVTNKKKLSVPAGTYDVYVIKKTTRANDTNEKQAEYFEYWAKNVGLIATGAYTKVWQPGWHWSSKLKSIEMPE